MAYADVLRAEVASVLDGAPATHASESVQEITQARGLAIELVASWKASNKREGRAAMRNGAFALAGALAAALFGLFFQASLPRPALIALLAASSLAGGAAVLTMYQSAARLRRTAPTVQEILDGYHSGDAARAHGN